MFPVRNPWNFIPSPTKSSPKEKGERRERQSALTCNGDRCCPPGKCVQDNLATSLRGSGACCRLEQRIQHQTHPGEKCDLGEPFHILPEHRPSEHHGVGVGGGFILSCQTGIVSLWKLISLQLESSPTSIHQAAMTLKNGLET